ncbi:extracellular solute-binding protein [Streptosporangium sp. 'caverna']|uniref:sugar ABC transporter substrate-binding protein n=1 Tax=Streptosporangium sp. 'caverna' TaxID=2202249 RepID=UPI000D7D8A75|nr:extracellular solute-binding protein [Streptosporangium sp. 'caverna']AWS44230.1 ABC transporter substrate-binding protein [Streptosporangium sp. 'caverna']
MKCGDLRNAALGLAVCGMVLSSTACGAGDGRQVRQSSGPAALRILIGSSGDTETTAVRRAADAWAASSGNTAAVTPAQAIAQQLGQAFAGDSPPDVFYVDASRFADYASVGALEPYGDRISDPADFYGNLRTAFTHDGRFYCAPKDFSTLALIVNDDLWKRAGLSGADVPTTWEQLTSVSERIKARGIVPLVIGDTHDRIGAFMVQAGGRIISPDGRRAVADSPENLRALRYVRTLLENKLARFPQDLDAGWSGEAFGKGEATMTIEGNWIEGALRADFPAVEYSVHELPAGPKGRGTLAFTNCWGIAAKSPYKKAAISFVEAMTTVDQQMAFARAFGAMPSRRSAKGPFTREFPRDTSFVNGAEYARGPVNAPKMESVLADFDAGLQQLARTAPEAILKRLQKNTQDALDD